MSGNEDWDPYRSPPLEAELVDESQRPLTRAERAVLELYFEHRDQPFTMGRLIWRMLPNWSLLIGLMATAMLIVYVLFPDPLPSYVLVGVIGTLTGALLRDVGVARRLVSMWPVLQDVFAWEKIAAKLGRV